MKLYIVFAKSFYFIRNFVLLPDNFHFFRVDYIHHSDTPLTCMTSYCMIRTSTQSDKKHNASDYQYIQGGHMYQLDFDKPIHVFFSGIGGISMSGLAQILRSRGFEVSGSDRAASSITDELAADGIRVIIGQRKESTDKKTSLNAALRDFGVSV